MSRIDIVPVNSRRLLRRFVDYPDRLYHNCPQWVPALRNDELDTFNPRKNGAYAFSESACFLAECDGQTVGRVAAIINHHADDTDGVVRFGWLDFEDDTEVLRRLIDAVANWGRQRGRTVIKGPWGFTDMDKEGLLVEGFEHLSPFTCLYNHPYYDLRLQELGFVKDVDWTQRTMQVESELPSAFQYTSLIEERFGIHVVKARSTRQIGRHYGMALFHMYNEAFAPLAGFSPLTDQQVKTYLRTYVPILDKDFVAIAVDTNDQPVGFLACVPSLSQAIRRAHGRLTPWGLMHLFHALKHNDTLEALIIGVDPKYQNCGVPLLLFRYLHTNCLRRGIGRIVFNPQLEENHKVQNLFSIYNTEPYMRRRAYKRDLTV